MKLVDNWNKAWTWLSMWFITGALIWEGIPEEAKDAALSESSQGRITMALLIAAGVGRMVKQSETPQ